MRVKYRNMSYIFKSNMKCQYLVCSRCCIWMMKNIIQNCSRFEILSIPFFYSSFYILSIKSLTSSSLIACHRVMHADSIAYPRLESWWTFHFTASEINQNATGICYWFSCDLKCILQSETESTTSNASQIIIKRLTRIATQHNRVGERETYIRFPPHSLFSFNR